MNLKTLFKVGDLRRIGAGDLARCGVPAPVGVQDHLAHPTLGTVTGVVLSVARSAVLVVDLVRRGRVDS